MKTVFFILFLCTTVINATEIELHRVSVMVDDIKELREHYEKALQEEQQKNETLQKKLNMALEAVKSLRDQIKSEISSQKQCVKSSVSDENSFPKLKTKRESVSESVGKIIVFKASPFRLKKDAKIYNSFEDPKYLFTWDKGRSFTSNQKTDGWIKITGYFVNRVWQPASEELWVHEEDVLQRESK